MCWADGHHQLDLVVQVLCQAGVGHLAGLAAFDHDQAVSGLQKEEGRLAAGETHLFGVFFVIAADAINAVHWKAFSMAQDGH
jgi:hypothetical protein